MKPSRPAARHDARTLRLASALAIMVGAALLAEWPAAAQGAAAAEAASAPRISPYSRAARTWAETRAQAASAPTGVAKVGAGTTAAHPSKKGPRH